MGAIAALGLGVLNGCGAEEPQTKLKIIDGSTPSDNGLIEQSTVALVSSSGQVFCTGTLIDSRAVVSAAHCLENYRGTLYIGFGRNSSEFTYVQASSFSVNPSYNGSFAKAVPADISAITLSQNAPSGYTPVNITSVPSRGSTVYLAGYGQTETGGSGQLFYKAVTVQSQTSDEFVVSNGACYGDSGGPAFVYDSAAGTLSVAGATSRGATGCRGTAVYTSVPYFSSWINSVTP